MVDTTGSFTVAAWVDLAASTGSDEAVVVAGRRDRQRVLPCGTTRPPGTGSSPAPLADTTTRPAGPSAESGARAAATGTWTFLTGTYNANTGAMTLYVNGTGGRAPRPTPRPIAAHGPFRSARQGRPARRGDCSTGRPRDVQVYPRALSAAEVSQL